MQATLVEAKKFSLRRIGGGGEPLLYVCSFTHTILILLHHDPSVYYSDFSPPTDGMVYDF